MARYVIVGFRVDEENSVFYRKCDGIEDLKRALYIAMERRDCDFVSIRKIKSRAPSLEDEGGVLR